MYSFNQWKPEFTSGAQSGKEQTGPGHSLWRRTFSRLFVVLAVLGLGFLLTAQEAQAQASVTLTLSTNTFIEGDPNPVAGTVAINGPALTPPQTVTVNIFYQLPAGTGPQTLVDSVVFVAGEENTAKPINITVGNDSVSGNQTVEIIATASGPAPYGGETTNAPGTQTQVDPRGIFLTEVAATTSESDPVNGSRTFLDVSLVDPANPAANLGELTPTRNVFVSLRVANATNNEDSAEALLSTDAQPTFQQQQVLVFTPQNFQQPQRVYVQGVDDAISDGDQLYRVMVVARNAQGNQVQAVVAPTRNMTALAP